MSEFPVGNVDFVRQEESSASSVKLSVYFSAGDGYYQMVKFRTKVHISGSGIDKTVYANEWTFGPILNYVDSYQKWQYITINGLPSGKTFMCVATLLYCVYEDGSSTDTTDISGDWKTTGKTSRYVATTVGMPEPFNWNGTNYSRYHGYIDSGYATRFHLDSTGASVEAPYYFNATAEQTQKAYKSITTGGLTTDFSTKVWNDIVDRVSWVQEAWGYKQKLSDTSGAIGAGYLYAIKPIYRQQPVPGGMLLLAGSAMNADVFNQVINAIPIVTTWPWEKELGRKNIKSGDICKGSYFIALVNVLNRWISLVPVPFAITDVFSHSMTGKVNQLPSVPLESGYAFKTTYNFSMLDAGAISVSHSGKIGNLSDIIDLTVENGVLPFASQFNFFDFNTEMCKAASVDAYVMGEFNGNVKQPTQVVDIGFASTLTIQNSGQIAAPKHTVDLTAPPGCVIGEHGYTLHTQSAFQIGTAPAFYLEHNGIFGIVNEFTITPKDNDQSVLEGTIGFADTIDGMITEPGVVMEYSKQLSMSDSFTASTSTGNVMSQDAQIRLVGTTDITSSTIIPLELDGNVSMSATVDDMREGRIFEIVDGSASVAIKPTSEVAVINTVGLSSMDTKVGISAIAENNANDPIELDGNVTATVGLDESVLNSQRDVLISASANNAIKSVSTVNSAKRKIVDGSASVAIKPTSEVAVINTVGLSSMDTKVGISAIAENNANDPIELDGNVTATVGLDESVLNSQRDVLISASANNAIKSVSTVNSAKRKIVDGSASVAIKPTSEVATAKPRQAESHEVLVTEESVGTLIRKPRVHMSSAVVNIMSTTETTMGAINMTHTRSVSVDERVVVGGIAEMTASKGQKEIGIEHVEIINAEAVLAYKVPTALNSSEAVRIDAIGTADKSSSYLIESESETVLVRSEASLSLGTVSLILASELDDTLVSELDDTFAYDAERIIRITANNDSNTK